MPAPSPVTPARMLIPTQTADQTRIRGERIGASGAGPHPDPPGAGGGGPIIRNAAPISPEIAPEAPTTARASPN